MNDLAAETERRREVEKELFQAEKLDALGKVAGGIAHDFGNVLTAVQLNLDFLRGYTMSAGQAALNNAISGIERGSEAVRSLLIFARRGSFETEIVDTRERIADSVGLLRHAIGTGSTLEILIDEDLWPIEINANQLELALLNLTINARDAMPGGGALRVTARNTDLSGSPDGLAGEFVEISVSDTGCGMAPEIAAKAIEPFFTTKEAGKGTGLGLSQVYGVAKHAGGAMTLTSAVGQGTTVTLYFPKRSAPDRAEPA
jgi:signal transduction histidine kinase